MLIFLLFSILGFQNQNALLTLYLESELNEICVCFQSFPCSPDFDQILVLFPDRLFIWYTLSVPTVLPCMLYHQLRHLSSVGSNNSLIS